MYFYTAIIYSMMCTRRQLLVGWLLQKSDIADAVAVFDQLQR